jgi:hypothetical protein
MPGCRVPFFIETVRNQSVMQSNTEISKTVSRPLPTIRRDSLRGRGRGEDRFTRSIRRAISSGIVSGELARAFHGWAALWKLPQLQNRVTLHLNPRLRTTIARWVIDSSGLEVSTRFFALRDQRQILCHELAHAAAVMKYGRAVRSHGPEWCRLIRMAGFEPHARRAPDRPRGQSPDVCQPPQVTNIGARSAKQSATRKDPSRLGAVPSASALVSAAN